MSKDKVQIANQRVFDEALKHIRKQGCSSVRKDSNQCVYLNDKGLGCAFAPCIMDYSKDLEQTLAGALLYNRPEVLHPWARDCSGEVAGDIQSAHDGASTTPAEFMDGFESRMKEAARVHNLKYEPAKEGATS